MIDFLLDNTDDLTITNGDFAIGEADPQHVYLVTKSSFGDWREFPILGANLREFVNSNAVELIIRNRVKLALQSDNWVLKSFKVVNNEISVTATKL